MSHTPGPEDLPARGHNTPYECYRHRIGAMRTSENPTPEVHAARPGGQARNTDDGRGDDVSRDTTRKGPPPLWGCERGTGPTTYGGGGRADSKGTPPRWCQSGVRKSRIVAATSLFFRDLRVIQECAWKDSNLRHPV